MAIKRMLSQHVIVTDDFLRLPHTAMVLYFFLNLTADDDGFNAAPEDVMRRTRSSNDDLRLLVEKEFILILETGVTVIRHWLVNNTLRKDTYHPTLHQESERIGFNKSGEYVHIELLPSGEKCLDDYVRMNGGNPLSIKRVKELKANLLTDGSVDFELDTNPVNVGERREEKIRQGEEASVDGQEGKIPYSQTHLYGDEENILLDNSELEKIYSKYQNPGKLINKVSYILLNSKARHRSHYAYINKIALEDNWPIKRKKECEADNEIAPVNNRMTKEEIADSLSKAGATEEMVAAVMNETKEYGEVIAELAMDRLRKK